MNTTVKSSGRLKHRASHCFPEYKVPLGITSGAPELSLTGYYRTALNQASCFHSPSGNHTAIPAMCNT